MPLKKNAWRLPVRSKGQGGGGGGEGEGEGGQEMTEEEKALEKEAAEAIVRGVWKKHTRSPAHCGNI